MLIWIDFSWKLMSLFYQDNCVHSMTSKEQANTRINTRKGIDNKLLLLFVLLGIAGLILFAFRHKSVFPSAAINLSVSKADILKLAETWNSKLAYAKTNVIKSITFGCDDDVKTFLEYELGNESANQLMQKQIPVFYWYCAFKKEFDQEKMLMTISPAGELLFFDHVLPNDLALKTIAHEEARTKAFDFVLKQTGWLAQDCKLVEDNVDKQLHRDDYDFVWENQKADWKGAKLRASASYAGNIFSGYYKFLKLPESWERKYQTIRSYNNLLQTIATIFYSLLHLAAAFIFFRAITQGEMRWRFVLRCAAILTVICFLDNSNDLAAAISAYDPHKSYSAFLCMTAFNLVGSLPFSFIGIAIIVGAAESVYRWAFPDKPSWQEWFTLKALRSRYVISGLILGYATFGISIGYQILYYSLGEKLGFWCPLGVDKHEILTAAQPWFSALTLGVFASGAEELLYRVIMLGLCQKILKRFWLANILQAMAWGFMHSSYPQQPCYARGVELTIEGIFWGWILKRYGLLPCLVSHYLFDVFCDSVPLFSAQIVSLKLSPFIPLLPFLLLAIIGAWLRHRQGKTVDESVIDRNAESNSANAQELSVEDIAPEAEYVYKPLAKNTRWKLAAAILVCFMASLCWPEPHYEIYQNIAPLKTSRQAAIKIAHDYLEKNHFDLKGYMPAANCENGLLSHKENYQYIFEKSGFDRADKIAYALEQPHLWSVRFFKPGCVEEYTISVDADGTVLSQTINKAEDAVGAKLSEEQAKQIAADYLHRYRPIYEPLVFDDVQVTNRAHRTDYAFQFKSTKYKIADADLIVTIDVLGDIPSYEGHYWDIPDEWKWNKTKITLAKALAMIAMSVLSLVVFGLFIWWTVSLFITKAVRWRPALIPGMIFLMSMGLLLINMLPSSFVYYQTTIPLPIYIVVLIVGGLLGILSGAAFTIFGFALSVAAIRQLGIKQQVIATFKNLAPRLAAAKKKMSFNFWLDAILIAGIYGLFSHLYTMAELTLSHSFNQSVVMEPLTVFHAAINSTWPALSEISMVTTSILGSLVFLAILIGMLAKFGVKTNWQILLLITGVSTLSALSSLFSASEFHWQESLCNFVFGTVSLFLYWFFLRQLAWRNGLSLLIWLFCGQIFAGLKELFKYGWPLCSGSIIFLAVIALLPLGYLIYLKTAAYTEK